MPKKAEKLAVVPSHVLDAVAEIQELVKIRAALGFGSKSGARDSAESVMSRQINSKVISLAEELISIFGKK